MGRIVTPPYRVEYRDNLLALGKTRPDGMSRVDRKSVLMMGWDGKRDGRPTAANLAKWRETYNISFQPGGSNAHVGGAFGAVPHIYWARLVRQRDDAVVAEVAMPAFEAA